MVFVVPKRTCEYSLKNIFRCLESSYGAPYMVASELMSFTIPFLGGGFLIQYTEYGISAFVNIFGICL